MYLCRSPVESKLRRVSSRRGLLPYLTVGKLYRITAPNGADTKASGTFGRTRVCWVGVRLSIRLSWLPYVYVAPCPVSYLASPAVSHLKIWYQDIGQRHRLRATAVVGPPYPLTLAAVLTGAWNDEGACWRVCVCLDSQMASRGGSFARALRYTRHKRACMKSRR